MDRELYLKIAHWYYTLGLTQEEIARRLSITRQRVNRIIGDLTELGIVTIKVNGVKQGSVYDEHLIEERFGIDRVIIAERFGEEDPFLPVLAHTAAHYIEECIQPGMIIGTAWGSTLAATINNIPYRARNGCTVVQMAGTQNIDVELVRKDEIPRFLADRLDCACYILHAPAVVDHPETKRMLMQERAIQKSFDLMRKCDVAILSLGQFNRPHTSNTMFNRGLLRGDDIDRLITDGFVGDICVNPVTIDGRWERCALSDRVISADMEILHAIPNLICVAGGETKTQAIMGCLASGVINTMITDDQTAKRIIAALGLDK